MSCSSCGSKSLTHEDISGNLICASCGTVQKFDNYDSQLHGRNGPTGTYVHVGTAGTGSALHYKDKKLYESQKLIHEYTYKLNLTQRGVEIRKMIDKITEGEFGLGEWFPILIGACSYVVMRMDNKSLPIAEVASVLNCDVYELGRMITHVVEFLNVKLPELDVVIMFERTIRNSKLSKLTELQRDKLGKIKKQGVFLLNCAVKWFLTTGRRPVPVVVAVLVFVAEINEVSLKIEDVAKEIHCVLSTCRRRYSELLEALVKVAQALPWGKDVNVKNIVKNAPFVMGYMEMKSMEKSKGEREGLNCGEIDLGDVVGDCLKSNAEHEIDEYGQEFNARNVDVDARSGLARPKVANVDGIKLSHECLRMIYTKFSKEVDGGRLSGETGDVGVVNGRKVSRGFVLSECREWWNGKSEFSKKVMLEKILEKDVGLDTMPPSFVKGNMVYERRRAKIHSAKVRINKIMHPSTVDEGETNNACFSESVHGKRRKRKRVGELDWEDFIIETLLLHQVKEEEIETGYYKTLLGLHVFNSGVM